MMRAWGWTGWSRLFAGAGVAVAAYLTVVHYDEGALVCGVGDCRSVQASRYAELAGVPISLLGLAMFLAVFGLGLLRRSRPDLGATATILAFALALAGTVYAAYLTYLEVAVIDAVCQWCVASALLTVGVLAAEGVGVRRVLDDGLGA